MTPTRYRISFTCGANTETEYHALHKARWSRCMERAYMARVLGMSDVAAKWLTSAAVHRRRLEGKGF